MNLNFIFSQIKHFLFRANMPFGGDLRALDIQRNRDHGLGSYNDFREFCGLKRAYAWEGFLDLISTKVTGLVTKIDILTNAFNSSPFKTCKSFMNIQKMLI